MRGFSKFVPHTMRLKVRKQLLEMLGGTVAQGWENYAKSFRAEPGKHLGDEWNEPELIGMDVAPDQIVPALDQQVFQPFLGRCDVILEIGSGGGRLTEILFPKCERVIAADTSAAMLSLLKERVGRSTKLECVLLDGFGLGPIPDESVNAVFSYDVFVHLEPWDIFNYLCEIKRVLRPGGKALVHHANSFSDLGWKRFVAETPRQLNVPKDWGTFSLMTPEIFGELAKRAGLLHLDCLTNIVRRDAISLMQSPAHSSAVDMQFATIQPVQDIAI